MKKFKIYFSISIISILLSFYLLETYLNYKNIKKNINIKIKIYENETGKKYDLRSRYDVYLDSIKKNEKAELIIYEHGFNNYSDILPLSGLSNSKTIVCNENGEVMIIESDRYGFNNPDDEWENSNSKIALLGDSFTYGFCVNRPNDIGSQIREQGDYSVLNLGFSGTGPLNQYAILHDELFSKEENPLNLFPFQLNGHYNSIGYRKIAELLIKNIK